MSTAATNGHALQVRAWHTESVRSFFEQIPWTGTRLIPPSREGTEQAHAMDTSEMCLSVRHFFDRFAWDGKPNIATPATPFEVQFDSPAEDSLTLDGFADLF